MVRTAVFGWRHRLKQRFRHFHRKHQHYISKRHEHVRCTLRANDTDNFSLIGPIHVPTGLGCISRGIRYAVIGSHYATDSGEGEEIKIVTSTRRRSELMRNGEYLKKTFVDDTVLYSYPICNQSSCTGDYGGPLVAERPEGDVLVRMMS
ncbi:Serine protease trypsin-like protein [Phytophthora megakarya]|uniref:Serine protease trypsin-like protein n=1 Tax=Phytophthora megakarya TaxID=4795 RepID=A0A225VJ36_9STRA|nr:Serine protease trypsin-like protein [Phytophthora megakarya]